MGNSASPNATINVFPISLGIFFFVFCLSFGIHILEMSDTLSKALSAVAEALANPPPPEQVNAETACQMLEAMDKLRVMLEPSNLRILNLSVAVRSEPELEDGKTTIRLTNFTNSLML